MPTFPAVKGTMPGGSHLGFPRDGGQRKHQGLDIFAPHGSPVVAAVSGRLRYARSGLKRGGMAVSIEDEAGNWHYYAHLSYIMPSLLGKSGIWIEEGQQIGSVGATGNAKGTDPHLHYSINEGRYGRPLIDPFEFLSGAVSLDAGEASVPDQPQGPVEIPSDARMVSVGPHVWATFEYRGQKLAFLVDQAATGVGQPEPITHMEWSARGYINGGSIGELSSFAVSQDGQTLVPGINPGETMTQVLDRLLRLLIPDEDAWTDPGIINAVLQRAARPDMSDTEWRQLISQTAYANAKTQRAAEWNDLSEAEQQARIDEYRLGISDMIQRTIGEFPSPQDARVSDWATRVASGQWTLARAELEARKIAEENPESPWSRRVRDELEQQRRRGVDIENLVGDVRSLSRRWGVELSPDVERRWAEMWVANEMSEQDIVDNLKTQAQVLYPWKDPEQETEVAAQPWLNTYNRVMEANETLFNPHVQRALQNGTTVFDFEQDLKLTDEYKFTGNFQAEMSQVMSQVSEQMGFS